VGECGGGVNDTIEGKDWLRNAPGQLERMHIPIARGTSSPAYLESVNPMRGITVN
jgi:hypothetical protein